MKTLWNHLTELFTHECKAEGFYKAVLNLSRSLRALWYQAQHRQLFELKLFQKYIAIAGAADVLFHLSHRHYLSNALTFGQRIQCALSHYRYEDERYDDSYKNAVYRDGGLPLWSQVVGANRFSIRLRASTDNRHEGGNSVVLFVNEKYLCEMSFAWVDAAIVGAVRGVVPFIARNQSAKPDAQELHQFRQAFPHNSPHYFCLAAMSGMATAHGKSHLSAIDHRCQIAFKHRYATSFRNSYGELWKSFGGVRSGRHSYLLPVPLTAPPLSEVKCKHRKRALERRQLWSTIEECASAAIGPRLGSCATSPRPVSNG